MLLQKLLKKIQAGHVGGGHDHGMVTVVLDD